MATNQGPITAFALSLAGGIIIFVVGIVGLAWFGFGEPAWGGLGNWMSGMMNNYHGFGMGGENIYGFFGVLSFIGLFSGAVMITGAFMLRMHPQDHLTWGILILIFSIVSFAGMGGYFIGAVLGIIGGAFAIAYRPKTTPMQTPTQPQ